MSVEFVEPYIDQETGVLRNLVRAKTYDELRNAEGDLSGLVDMFLRIASMCDSGKSIN